MVTLKGRQNCYDPILVFKFMEIHLHGATSTDLSFHPFINTILPSTRQKYYSELQKTATLI